MIGTTGWTEADYYAARDSCRAAWQATDQQLALGLGEGDAPRDVSLAEPAIAHPPPGDVTGSTSSKARKEQL